MAELIIDLEAEKKEILKRYRALLKACKPNLQKGDKRLIRQAFDMSLESHQDMRRKSGEPYIYHPIAVAQIAAEEIGLGTTSIVCALLHDVVEDTDITLEDIEIVFGKKVAKIIDGLTKISGVFDYNSSLQAENFRKMLLTLADDVRVILIKLLTVCTICEPWTTCHGKSSSKFRQKPFTSTLLWHIDLAYTP